MLNLFILLSHRKTCVKIKNRKVQIPLFRLRISLIIQNTCQKNFLKHLDDVDTKYKPSSGKQNLEDGHYNVTFRPETENYCLGMVDMVDSTQISATLGNERMSRYYQIFLNSMSKIINEFDGKVVKNIGDCLLYYFPVYKIKNPEDYLIKSLECSFAMVESHDFICKYLKKESLPCLDYRISMDYGNVTLMKSSDSASIDMIGTPINMCAKINRKAPTNGIVVGGDIREMLKKVHRYEFEEIDGYSIGLKLDYPIYVVKKNIPLSKLVHMTDKGNSTLISKTKYGLYFSSKELNPSDKRSIIYKGRKFEFVKEQSNAVYLTIH